MLDPNFSGTSPSQPVEIFALISGSGDLSAAFPSVALGDHISR